MRPAKELLLRQRLQRSGDLVGGEKVDTQQFEVGKPLRGDLKSRVNCQYGAVVPLGGIGTAATRGLRILRCIPASFDDEECGAMERRVAIWWCVRYQR